MSNDTTTKTRPTHRIYNVAEDAAGKRQWTEIGAAWAHKDGKGFTLDFTAAPAEGQPILLRIPRIKSAAN